MSVLLYENQEGKHLLSHRPVSISIIKKKYIKFFAFKLVCQNMNFSFVSLCSWVYHTLQLLRRYLDARYSKSLVIKKLCCDNVLKYTSTVLFPFLERLILVAIRFFDIYVFFRTTEGLKYRNNKDWY